MCTGNPATIILLRNGLIRPTPVRATRSRRCAALKPGRLEIECFDERLDQPTRIGFADVVVEAFGEQ
jgi:hypothetical protein